MYVHTHWGYNRPYAARSWTLDDWDNYLSGLASLGYDLVKLWPLLDCMPPEPNASDRAFLGKIAKVIDLAHDKYGMKFAIVVCPNTMGNDKAAAYPYETRPYFVCERKLNPADPTEFRALMDARRRQLEPLAKADMLVIIDSDPGGYIGSTNAEFVNLMKGQIEVFREFNPEAELYYWMLVGWETYNKFWEATQNWKEGEPLPTHPSSFEARVFVETLEGMKRDIPEPWGVLAGMQVHADATSAVGVADKQIFYPYGVVEGEPTFPMTNYFPEAIERRIGREYDRTLYPRGVIANSQTHCLQLPNAYLFAHYAKHGPGAEPDMAAFGEDLLVGLGPMLAQNWAALAAADGALQNWVKATHSAATQGESASPQPVAQHSEALFALAAGVRQEVGKRHSLGKSAGLLFGSPDRFLEDLAMNLEVRAGMVDFASVIGTADADDAAVALRALLGVLRPYQEMLGFRDAAGGPLAYGFLYPLGRLGDPAVQAALRQLEEWRDLGIRNGVMVRILDSADAYCRARGV